MTTIVEFLTARLDERETIAREAQEDTSDGREEPPRWKWTGHEGVYAGRLAIAVDGFGYMDDTVGKHIARHDPAYVLADIAAKRKILALHEEKSHRECRLCEPHDPDWPCRTVRTFAAPFASHPDYDESWRP